MWRMCGYEGNVTNYEECEGARGKRVGEMWGCEREEGGRSIMTVRGM
jgi:hypothetical protein